MLKDSNNAGHASMQANPSGQTSCHAVKSYIYGLQPYVPVAAAELFTLSKTWGQAVRMEQVPSQEDDTAMNWLFEKS